MSAKVKVLLAEDDDILRTAYTDYLKRDGFTIIAVDNAKALIEQASKADALVIDARLPTDRLEGIEAVGKLVTENKITASVPVIFISVHSETDEPCDRKLRAFPRLEGRYTWLQKHFESELLAITIRDELQNRTPSPKS